MNKINHSLKLGIIESLLLALSSFFRINLFVIYNIIEKIRKSTFRFLILNVNPNNIILNFFNKNKLLKSSLILWDFLNSYNITEDDDQYKLIINIAKTKPTFFEMKSNLLLSYSFVFQSLGLYRFALILENIYIEKVLYTQKTSLSEAVNFVKLTIYGNSLLDDFLFKHKLEKVFPADKLMSIRREFWKDNTHKVKSVFIGPLINVSNYKPNNPTNSLIIPNPTEKLVKSIMNGLLEQEIVFAFREIRSLKSFSRESLEFILKRKLILEKPNPLRFIIFKFIHLKLIDKLQKKGSDVIWNDYELNYIVFNGLPFYVHSILINSIENNLFVTLDGINFFAEKEIYSASYRYALKSINEFSKSELKKFNNELADHNLISNYRLLKTMEYNKQFLCSTSVEPYINFSISDYSSRLETILRN